MTTTLESDEVLRITTEDPKKGDVEYIITPFIFTQENVKRFWERSSRFPTLFNREVRSDFKRFLETLMARDAVTGAVHAKGLFWQIYTDDDPLVGVFYLSNIIVELEATAHFTFLDGRLRGRGPVAKKMMEYVFNTYKFRRLNVELPYFVGPAIFSFVKHQLGFIQEGKKRNAAMRDGNVFDVGLFGIIREEVLSNGDEC